MNSRRGSQWRKWDLHVHTPESFEHHFEFEGDEEQEEYDDQWDKYIDELAAVEDIAAIGITDYMTVDGYERVKDEFNNGNLDNFDLVLPNIEFRLNTIVNVPGDGDTKRINAHVIFDDSIDIGRIRRDFLHTIQFQDSNGDDWALRRENIEELGQRHIEANPEEDHLSHYEAGCKIITVGFDEILDSLSNSEFKNRHMIVLAKDGWDDMDWNTQGHLTKERLFRECDALFSSNPNQIQWALGNRDGLEEFQRAFGKPTPCIWGSDAHSYGRLCTPDEDRYCWIKADSTFEGLKQVVHEPEKRVKIQADSPRGYTRIHNLKNIRVSQGNIDDRLEVADQELPLNHDLVTVIGGKGAGKTALLDLIANCFKDRWDRSKSPEDDPEDQNSFIQRIQDKDPEVHTSIEFEGENVDNFSKTVKEEEFFEASDLVYLPQGKIEEYCRDEDRLHDHIIQLVKESVGQDEGQMIDRFEALEKEASDVAQRFRNKTSNIYNLNPTQIREDRLDLQSQKQRKLGDLESKTAEIQEFEEKHQEVIEDNRASELRSRLDEVKAAVQKFDRIRERATDIQNNISIVSETNSLLDELEKDLAEEVEDFSFPRIQTTIILEKLSDAEEAVEEQLQEKKKQEDEIRNELNQLDEVEQEYSGLLEEKERIESNVRELEGEIEEAERKLNEVNELREGRRVDFTKYVWKYNELENQYRTIIDEFSDETTEILEDISFEPSIRVDDMLFDQLERLLDMRSVNDADIFNAIRPLKEAIEEDVQEQVEERVNHFLDVSSELKENTKAGTQDVEFESTVFDTHLTLAEDIFFRGSPMPSLSLGQKGTVLLKILLEESDEPLIIDQPEENLDNEFIYDTLVGAFRDAKVNRQVIIATHNANLVVNTDAEQVIVARYEDNVIDFNSGALENEDIRSDITTILEGGEEAFRKREQRYEIPESAY